MSAKPSEQGTEAWRAKGRAMLAEIDRDKCIRAVVAIRAMLDALHCSHDESIFVIATLMDGPL